MEVLFLIFLLIILIFIDEFATLIVGVVLIIVIFGEIKISFDNNESKDNIEIPKDTASKEYQIYQMGKEHGKQEINNELFGFPDSMDLDSVSFDTLK